MGRTPTQRRRLLFWLAPVCGVLVALVMHGWGGEAQKRQARHPVLLQYDVAAGARLKAVPVYPDEREQEARARLLATVECASYDIVDEGTAPWIFPDGARFGEQYYLYVRYRCPT